MATTNTDPTVTIEKEKTKRSVIIVLLIIFGIIALITICCILPLAYGVYEGGKIQDQSATSTEGITYQIGDEVKLGDFTYVVVDAVDAGNQLTSLNGQTETTSGTFLKVDFTAKNNGTESAYLGIFELSDSEGNTYNMSDKQSLILTQDNGTFTQVNPGITTNFTRLYEIPNTAVGLNMKITASILGGESANISLGY